MEGIVVNSHPRTSSFATARVRSGASSLLRLYVIRGLIAILWAVGFATVLDSLAAGTIILLVVYPLIDAVAVFIDFRDRSGMPGRGLQLFNIAVSTLAAVALAIAGNIDVPSVLLVFGGWAIVSGVAQLVAALHRHRPEMGRQWSLLLAGALSVLAGGGFGVTALGDDPRLNAIVMYAGAGGAFFVIQAGLLYWRLRRR
ncbi:DUF308 domain-containing protein [Pseudonocardia alaniniphila]|uniref:DUF308 domain-containing protein n=1 Tax=Pseudonocardia alaniniphila TaxID=75291 RepID=A0ABS9T782_9PSEU|nr:DUF308 domain-containing protein [Pseudonocardia alaniniphila]MCH6164308.1 DUF308 domain-containing protein [Pseudonocardia alaniniphila]